MTPPVAAVSLDDVTLQPEIRWALDRYREAHARGAVGDNHLRQDDYLRWAVVWDRLGEGASICDVGVGVGQFVNVLGHFERFPEVRGLDHRWATKLQRLTDRVDFRLADLAATKPPEPADVVTCLECIEHIGDPAFDRAVANLKGMFRKRLIVSVPYREGLPLSRAHRQRFTLGRLRALFPEGAITLAIREREVKWALVEIRRE